MATAIKNSLWTINIEPGQTIKISTGGKYSDRDIQVEAAAGPTILSGSDIPSSSLGKNGDIYIRLV